MPNKKTPTLEAGLKAFADFARHLADSSDEPSQTGISFWYRDLGGLDLSPEETAEFRDVVDMLVGAKDTRTVSRREVTRMTQTALLRSLGITSEKGFSAELLTEQVRLLRARLGGALLEWKVYLQVEGLDPSELPCAFGQVVFRTADDELKGEVVQLAPREHRSAVVASTDEGWDSESIAQLQVRAIDYQAALELARAQLSLHLDILNFFADLAGSSRYHAVVASPALPNRDRYDIAVRLDGGGIHESFNNVGPMTRPLSIQRLLAASQTGAQHLSDMLKSPAPTQVGKRVLAATRWAGRATVERRPESAFLLYAISLESLLLGPHRKGDLSYRIRNYGAHLLADDLDGRRKLAKLLGELYDLRSRIVHQGLTEVSESDLRDMRYFAKRTVVLVLATEDLVQFRTNEEFDRWFEDKVLG